MCTATSHLCGVATQTIILCTCWVQASYYFKGFDSSKMVVILSAMVVSSIVMSSVFFFIVFCKGMQCIFRITNYHLHRQFQGTSLDLLHLECIPTVSFIYLLVHHINFDACFVTLEIIYSGGFRSWKRGVQYCNAREAHTIFATTPTSAAKPRPTAVPAMHKFGLKLRRLYTVLARRSVFLVKLTCINAILKFCGMYNI